jgi:hypothetical protein
MDSSTRAWAHAISVWAHGGQKAVPFGIASKNTTATIATIAAVSRAFFGLFFLKTKVAAAVAYTPALAVRQHTQRAALC